jgi:DNA replication protein DnaC
VIALERAREQLETLGLVEAAATLDARLEAASKGEMPYAEFLTDLLGGELRVRRERYLLTRTKLARLPFKKTLEQFDLDAQPSIDRKQVNELASLSFIAHADNLILLGPPGHGKTHLSVAIGIQAIEHGYGVYFTSVHRLLEDLRVAHEERRLERRLRVYRARSWPGRWSGCWACGCIAARSSGRCARWACGDAVVVAGGGGGAGGL